MFEYISGGKTFSYRYDSGQKNFLVFPGAASDWPEMPLNDLGKKNRQMLK